MAYYINQIKDNVYNKYKYQYLDHAVGCIDLRQNIWDFNFKFIMINDCSLPIWSILMSVDIPYQQTKNIPLNLASDQTGASDLVKHNKKYAKIYESKFSLDISNNQYLKQDLNNIKLLTTMSFEVDAEQIKKSQAKISQEDLDGLIIETGEQRWSYEMYYTNTHFVNESTVINNPFAYQVLENGQCFPSTRPIISILNDYSLNDRPINDLIHFKSSTPFKVEECKVVFHYWIEGIAKEKTLETNVDVQKEFINELQICFDKNTTYDFINDTVVIDAEGIKGFYVPKHTKGYFQIELKLFQDNEIVKFIIKNNFDFQDEINKPHIDISNILINSLEGYKKVEF